MFDLIKNKTVFANKYHTHSEAMIVSCFFNPQNSPYRIKAFKMWYESIKHIKKFNENYKSDKLDLQRDQHLMSIRQNGERIGDIEIVDGKITTTGIIGDNQYDNFVELIKGLQGFNIKIDEFYW